MFDKNDKLCQRNEKEDLWFKDKLGNGYFFPKHWASEFNDDFEENPELYGYYPINKEPNSPVELGWVEPSFILSELLESTEDELQKTHPKLFTHLNHLNREQ